jgi:hypothetical protein
MKATHTKAQTALEEKEERQRKKALENVLLKDKFMHSLESTTKSRTIQTNAKTALSDGLTQNQIEEILLQIRKDEHLKKEQKKVAQDLEKELAKAIEAKEKDEIRNSQLESQVVIEQKLGVETSSHLYAATPQLQERTGDLYKNPSEMYQERQYDAGASSAMSQKTPIMEREEKDWYLKKGTNADWTYSGRK